MQDDWKLVHAGGIGYLDNNIINNNSINLYCAIININFQLRITILLSKSEWSIGITSTEIYLKKVSKTVFQNDAIAVEQQTGH